ncbi:hypothetical protein [Candidatus Amarolinea dominans]|uniref:hypothetical protein n=1 Tax=Candidatus Amarolinea dominans TaxID=3140696 RepID=UPI003135101F|nr:hypothetical protein [Anaerolineae bacterium]
MLAMLTRTANLKSKSVALVVFSRGERRQDDTLPVMDLGLIHTGPASGTIATCTMCSQRSRHDTVRRTAEPPAHRLYAKLLLTPNEEKRYLPAVEADIHAYQECATVLREELRQGIIRLPDQSLADGYNTRQAMGYNYRNWRNFFNDRQLLALGWLQEGIVRLSNAPTRDAFLILLSGVLEFNNMFASYKGEGTGAVRHMFAHHILKPERTPIEANVWGTPKSSGSFTHPFQVPPAARSGLP